MRQCVTNEAIRPCLIRMKANGTMKKKENSPNESSLHQFGKPGSGGEAPVSAANRCGSRDGNEAPGQPEQEKGEWWLQVRLEHPHVAIELIESYKRIAGLSLGEINYNLQLLESGRKRGPSFSYQNPLL
jgi:hypothetical protein